ncbi:MAG: hypothetical protein LBR47_03265 [Spirochaetaceae bacterium]|jgi:hypothetical protein|nr:hypothetical protein [Spirochaetaceae bacterium]
MNVSLLLLFTLLFISLLLLFFFFSHPSRKQSSKKSAPSPAVGGKRGDPGRCPLCNSALLEGEQIKSTVFSGGNERDRVCHITGCPHCFPYTEKGAERLCPVCGRRVPPEGYLRARMFLRPDGSKHVHITGCSECHRAGKTTE